MPPKRTLPVQKGLAANTGNVRAASGAHPNNPDEDPFADQPRGSSQAAPDRVPWAQGARDEGGSSRLNAPAGRSAAKSKSPDPETLTVDQKNITLFQENCRDTVIKHGKDHDKVLTFDFQDFSDWLLLEDDETMPSEEDLKLLIQKIEFFLEREAKKTCFVFMNDIGACRAVINVEDRILTNSTMFKSFRLYFKNYFKQAKHSFLMEFYAWIIDLCKEFPGDMRFNDLTTNPDSKMKLHTFLVSKLDRTSFSQIFKIVYDRLDYDQTFSRQMKAPYVNGKATPWYWVVHVVTTLGAALTDLAKVELNKSSNMTRNFRDTLKKDGTARWDIDDNMRSNVNRIFFALGAYKQFASLEIDDFIWKPVKYIEKNKKKDTSKSKRQAEDDLKLADDYAMGDLEGDALAALLMGATSARPSVPKSPRTASSSSRPGGGSGGPPPNLFNRMGSSTERARVLEEFEGRGSSIFNTSSSVSGASESSQVTVRGPRPGPQGQAQRQPSHSQQSSSQQSSSQQSSRHSSQQSSHEQGPQSRQPSQQLQHSSSSGQQLRHSSSSGQQSRTSSEQQRQQLPGGAFGMHDYPDIPGSSPPEPVVDPNAYDDVQPPRVPSAEPAPAPVRRSGRPRAPRGGYDGANDEPECGRDDGNCCYHDHKLSTIIESQTVDEETETDTITEADTEDEDMDAPRRLLAEEVSRYEGGYF